MSVGVRSDRHARRGMTLAEVLIALAILGMLISTLSTSVTRSVRATTQSGALATGGDLVVDQLETIKMSGSYDGIDSYVGVETPVAGYPGYTRQTMVQRVGGPTSSVDYRIVTVSVTAPALTKPVKKTTIISAY